MAIRNQRKPYPVDCVREGKPAFCLTDLKKSVDGLFQHADKDRHLVEWRIHRDLQKAFNAKSVSLEDKLGRFATDGDPASEEDGSFE